MEAYFQYRRLTKSIAPEVDPPPQQEPASSSEQIVQEKGGFEVTFEEGDGQDLQNWPMNWKLFYTAIIFLLVFATGWSSAADSTVA